MRGVKFLVHALTVSVRRSFTQKRSWHYVKNLGNSAGLCDIDGSDWLWWLQFRFRPDSDTDSCIRFGDSERELYQSPAELDTAIYRDQFFRDSRVEPESGDRDDRYRYWSLPRSRNISVTQRLYGDRDIWNASCLHYRHNRLP
jgi:hypothetical protein